MKTVGILAPMELEYLPILQRLQGAETRMLGGTRCTIDTPDILSCLDVMVEGPFIEAEKDITLKFRGSANQRIIDVPATLATGAIQLWQDDPAFTRGTI